MQVATSGERRSAPEAGHPCVERPGRRFDILADGLARGFAGLRAPGPGDRS